MLKQMLNFLQQGLGRCLQVEPKMNLTFSSLRWDLGKFFNITFVFLHSFSFLKSASLLFSTSTCSQEIENKKSVRILGSD